MEGVYLLDVPKHSVPLAPQPRRQRGIGVHLIIVGLQYVHVCTYAQYTNVHVRMCMCMCMCMCVCTCATETTIHVRNRSTQCRNPRGLRVMILSKAN